MQQLLRKLLTHPYIRGSALNFIGSLGVNFLSYIFNIIIGRFLGPQVYSEYFSLISIWYLAAMPAAVLQTVITKQVAHYASSNNTVALRQTVNLGLNYGAWWGLSIALFLSILSPFILSTLKTNNLVALLLVALILFLSYISGSALSYFVGRERYITFSILSGLSILGRLLLVVPFILLQNSVVSVLLAMLGGTLLQLAIVIVVLYRDFHSTQRFIPSLYSRIRNLIRPFSQVSLINSEISRTLRTTFIATFGLAAITQADVILARSRLSAEAAGIYASLAVTGKIIPFFTLPLVSVLLPQVTARIAKGQSYKSTILLACILVSAGSSLVAIFYTLFPQFVIKIFLGEQYLASAQYLGQFSLFQMLYSLTALGVFATIAMSKFRHASAMAIFALIQIITILILPPTITSLIYASLLATALSTLYYFYVLFFNTSTHR